jgi:hypothetical protein
MPVTIENVGDVFTYHAPDVDQIRRLERVRMGAKMLAKTILAEVPPCADQQAALRLLREAVMTANAAIALKGGV